MDCDEVVPEGESDGYDELRERFGVGTRWTIMAWQMPTYSVLNAHGS